MGIETLQKTFVLEHPEDQTMAIIMMKMTRIKTVGKAGRIRLLRIKEDGTRDPQRMRGRKKKIVFPVYCVQQWWKSPNDQ